ncbi:MAG: carbonic anhydrase family protein [Microcoleaceae cyanobacterium]
MKKITRWGACFLLSILTLAIVQFNQPIFSQNSVGEWGYKGKNGPENWGEIAPEFSTCKTGKEQSPINLEQTASNAELPAIQFDYKYSAYEVVNDGSTIKVNYAPGSSITVAGKKYELLQFHFHTPTEHQINGKTYPMEAHLVHQSSNGELAVIGVLMKEGEANRFIASLWSNIPKSPGQKQVIRGIKINASALPPQDQSYYNYSGSLTIPPCSEGVNWMVLKAPIEVSKEQIKQFQSLYNVNARPIQSLNNRSIQQSGN